MLKTKIFKSLFAIVLPILIFTLPVSAVDMSEWEWKDFNVKFSLPADMKVTKSTGEEFSAEDDSLAFDIYPWKDETETAESIAKEAFNTLATELGIDPKTVKKTDGGSMKINEYDAYLMEGEGKAKNGNIIYAVVGLTDPTSGVNFAAYVDFWSEDKEESLKRAVDILNSIKKMRKN